MSASVLLVDDEENFSHTLAERLSLRGIQVETVPDGAAALAYIARRRPGVVVLDVMMPGMSGFEVLRRLKELHPGMQVILLTGAGSVRDAIEGMHIGAFDYLTKPVDIEVLTAKISEAVKVRGKGRGRATSGD